MPTNAEVQSLLISRGLLDPPADGKWGEQSKAALQDFQGINALSSTGVADSDTLTRLHRFVPLLQLRANELASRVIQYMQKQSYVISQGKRRYNIVYLEGANENGELNADEFNVWNDRRLLIEIIDGVPAIVGNWLATTEPGSTYTYNPLNEEGAFRIAFGQYNAWQMGLHGRSQYPALVQCGNISGYRDRNEDGKRIGDLLVTGDDMGVNQHHGGNSELVGPYSAGCLVGQSIEGHEDFIEKLRGDRRYQVDFNYIWYTTIISGEDLKLQQ